MSRERSNARRRALQALYQWQLTAQNLGYIETQFLQEEDMAKTESRVPTGIEKRAANSGSANARLTERILADRFARTEGKKSGIDLPRPDSGLLFPSVFGLKKRLGSFDLNTGTVLG